MMLPNYVEAETSRYCNRQCEWCPNYVLKNRTTQELMPWDYLERIVNSLSLAQYRGWFAFHNYNEPLANPRILDELCFVRRSIPDAKTTIYTNGDNLTDELFVALISGGLSQMRITIYPKSASGKVASHEALWAWLRRKPFLKEKEWQEVVVRQGPALVHADHPETILISPDVSRYYDRGGTIPWLSVDERTKPCFLTSNSLSIDCEGNIKMCCNVITGNAQHREYFLGNVRDDDILEVWNSEIFENIRERHRRSDWSITPICRTCRQEIKPVSHGA